MTSALPTELTSQHFSGSLKTRSEKIAFSRMNGLLFYFRVVNTPFPSCQFNLFLSNPCLQNKSAQIFNKPLALDA